MEKFKFIDLFAGIGGFHLAMHSLGGECVFASEIDERARKTYEHNFRSIAPDLFENNFFNNDIRSINPEQIPEFDILCAGFPCQPFSQAGYKRGFDDNHNSERGNLFFNIVDILEARKPRAFFLENVRGIVSHDNGNTFKVIRNILEEELGYSFYFKIVKASDYGLPQLRPRAYMIGFRDEYIMRGFSFPPNKPLKFNMSDVWGGNCSREIGFTIRCGGRGSNINDRRNWDRYLVDDKIKQLMPKQGKKMQGFDDDFEFPVPPSHAMKQLGNSVAVDAIRECGKSLVEHMYSLKIKEKVMDESKNKGEWSESLSFIKLLNDRKLILADSKLNTTKNYFNVTKIISNCLEFECDLTQKGKINISSINNDDVKVLSLEDLVSETLIQILIKKIKNGKRTFKIEEFDVIQEKLGFTLAKGSSYQKSDLVIDIDDNKVFLKDQSFGIKSYLGNKPTLLNASGNTNFIYKVEGIDKKYIDEINKIETRTKLSDRIKSIYELGGQLVFCKTEKDTMEQNLKLVDSLMPEIISTLMLQFYVNRTSNIVENLKETHESGELNSRINYGDINSLIVKIKRLLVSVMLGFFPGEKWDGNYEASGTIVVKNNGEQVGFHIIDMKSLENYLIENIKFDTPSTTRHRYGKLIIENDGNLYFKLNLQLRF